MANDNVSVKYNIVPNNDGTDNEHTVAFVTPIEAVPGLEEFIKKTNERVLKLEKQMKTVNSYGGV